MCFIADLSNFAYFIIGEKCFALYEKRGGNMEAIYISINRAIPGMIVVEDIYSAGRDKIATKNTILNPKTIQKLKLHGINGIPVMIPPSLAEKKPEQNPNNTHANKIRSSIEFKKFKRDYNATIEALKSTMSSLLSDSKKLDDENYILECTSQILSECSNSMHTFDMLHCMRDQDDLTYVHSLNVALICNSFATWLNFSPEDTRQLTLAGLIHDIGKTQIPPEILNKPTRLTDQEYQTMKTHVLLGAKLVANSKLDTRVKQAVLSHHERYNGSGYPQGLTGDKIAPFAKIVAIADVYDAMTSSRVYRDAICPFDVVGTLEQEGYTKYDPAYLIPFLKHIVQSYINAPVMLSNTLVGEVVMINNEHLSKPIVKVDDQFYDLSKKQDIKIRSLL